MSFDALRNRTPPAADSEADVPPRDSAAERGADAPRAEAPGGVRAIDICAPPRPRLAVFASPHSGRLYPQDMLQATRLDPLTLRRSEDGFVDEIFADAPKYGAPLLRALFPRAFVDANREPYELDPRMFADPLPAFVNTRSARVAAGLGTIARIVTDGADIYRRKLTFAEAERRIHTCYAPYHSALRRLIDEARTRHGAAILIDCHSMPSVGGPLDRDSGRARTDIVLGDRFGEACAPALTSLAEQILCDLGYRVLRNAPYAGGYTTAHYGRPRLGVHALQIEINRALYMDETRIERGPGLAQLKADMSRLAAEICALEGAFFSARSAAPRMNAAE